MKKLIHLAGLSIALIYSANILSAQQYNPFQSGRYYHFSENGSGLILSSKVEHSATSGTDSIYTFNGFSRAFDGFSTLMECDYIPYDATIFYYSNSNPLFGTEMISSIDGSYRFIEPGIDTVLIQTQITPGTSWLFSSYSGDSATLISKSEGTVFGTSDSLLHIFTTRGDSIILSKHHGFTEVTDFFPESIPKHWISHGIESPAKGNIIPGFKDYFDFDVGDIFIRKYHEQEYYINISIITELTVIYKYVNTDSSLFKYGMQRRRVEIDNITYDTIYHSMDTILETHEDISYPRLRQFWRETNTWGNITTFHGSHPARFNNRHYINQYNYIVDSCHSSGDTIKEEYLIKSTYSGHSYEYGVGLGVTLDAPSVYGEHMWLECYKKGTETWGSCRDESFWTGPTHRDNPIPIESQIKFIQLSDGIKILRESDESNEDMNFELRDLNGKFLNQFNLKPGQNKLFIPTRGLSESIYLLSAKDKSGRFKAWKIPVFR